MEDALSRLYQLLPLYKRGRVGNHRPPNRFGLFFCLVLFICLFYCLFGCLYVCSFFNGQFHGDEILLQLPELFVCFS